MTQLIHQDIQPEAQCLCRRVGYPVSGALLPRAAGGPEAEAIPVVPVGRCVLGDATTSKAVLRHQYWRAGVRGQGLGARAGRLVPGR